MFCTDIICHDAATNERAGRLALGEENIVLRVAIYKFVWFGDAICLFWGIVARADDEKEQGINEESFGSLFLCFVRDDEDGDVIETIKRGRERYRTTFFNLIF